MENKEELRNYTKSKNFKHKYIFYLFATTDKKGQIIRPSNFLTFGRVTDGVAFAKKTGQLYDYKKLF